MTINDLIMNLVSIRDRLGPGVQISILDNEGLMSPISKIEHQIDAGQNVIHLLSNELNREHFNQV